MYDLLNGQADNTHQVLDVSYIYNQWCLLMSQSCCQFIFINMAKTIRRRRLWGRSELGEPAT